MKLTLIIPGYNVKEFIGRTLKNVFQQSATDFEVIYVDDASTDSTLNVIKTQFSQYIDAQRLKLLELKVNGGPATARQRALDLVETPYVAFMDADDEYTSSEVFQLLLDALEQERPDMLMFKYITDHGTLKLKKKCSLPQLMTAKEAMVYKIKSANPIWHYLWNKCYKMSVIKDCDIRFEEGHRSAEDVEFNRKFLKVAKKVMFLDKYLYSYNCTNASSVSRQTSSLTEESLQQRWEHETSRYTILLNDCVDLNREQICQPYLAKELARTAVCLTTMSRKMGGILPSIIENDILYPVLKEFICKARIVYHISKLKTKNETNNKEIAIMASTANRVAKNTGYLYAKMGITMFISLYTTRLILNSLGASDFGIFNLVGGTISMLMFLNNVMSAVTQRFISYAEGENDTEHKAQIFNTSVFFHFVISIIVFVILEVAALFLFDGVLKIPAERLYVAKVIYQCAAIATMFSIQTVPYDAVMNAHENMLYYSIIGIVESLFKLIIALVVVYTAQDKLIIYGLLTAVLSFLLRMVMQFYCHKHYEECKISLRSINYPTMKKMSTFAAWNSANAIVSLVCNYGSGIVLNRFFGTVVNAAQGLTNQVSGQMGVLGNTVTKVVNPVIVKSAGAGNYERLLKSTIIGDKVIFFLTSIVFLPIIANLQPVLKIWLGDIPPYTILFIQLFLTCNIIDTCAICLNTAINGVGNIKGLSTVNAIANAIPLAICIPCFIYGSGPEYYYWLFMLASLVKLASRAYYSSKVCNFNLRRIVLDDILRTLIACFGTLALALALSLWLFSSESFATLLASVITDLIIYVVVYWILALSKDERLYISDFVRQLSSKFIHRNN